MPAEWPKYPAREQVVEYLERYCVHFGLEPSFGTAATRLERRDGAWVAETSRGVRRAKNVVVATGYTRRPVRPRWPGMEAFRGRILHSSEYKDGDLDIGTMDHLRARRIALHGGVKRFTEHGVVFEDDGEEAFDAVVLATGYEPGLDDFLVGWRDACEDGVPRALGGGSELPGLYFCGFYVAPSGMFREIGIEAGASRRRSRGRTASRAVHARLTGPAACTPPGPRSGSGRGRRCARSRCCP